jgi:hypothetical protein
MAQEWYSSNLNLQSSKRKPAVDLRGYPRILMQAVLLLIRVDQRSSAVRVLVFDGR